MAIACMFEASICSTQRRFSISNLTCRVFLRSRYGAAGLRKPRLVAQNRRLSPVLGGRGNMRSKLTVVVLCIVSLRSAAQATKSEFFKTSDGIRIHYLEAGSGRP